MMTDMVGPGASGELEDDWSWDDGDTAELVRTAIDTSKPSVARIYDYLLGGKDNHVADRVAAERLMKVVPGAAEAARANRAFMVRSVRAMAEAGVDQFLDLGTGIPTSPNVHETARTVHQDACAVYVDNDPIVLAHSRALLTDDARVVVVPHDLRDPCTVLENPAVRQVLDLDRPIGLLMVAVAHFVDVATASAVVARYVDGLPAGSRVAISAITCDGVDPEVVRRVESLYSGTTAPIVHRTRAEIEELFGGLRLLPPGLEDVFRSDRGRVLGGIALK